MDDIKFKLDNCRSNLCNAQLDLMDFVKDSGFIEPKDPNLLFILDSITSLINRIDSLC